MEGWGPVPPAPAFKRDTTDDMVEKSRVLSGVGPEEADLRYFDWDESCSDPLEREKVLAAWQDFQILTVSTSQRLTELGNSLPAGPAAEKNKYIQAENPAYMQMFGGLASQLKPIQKSYNAISSKVQLPPDQRGLRGGPGALRFICNSDNHVKNGNDAPLCDNNGNPTDAQTIVPQGEDDLAIEQKYRFSTATSIVFCPRFFDDDTFSNMATLEEQSDFVPSLKNVDCRERVMLHEYLHVPWTMNMRPKGKDYTGYLNIAKVAAGYSIEKVLLRLPDAYAWYALYSYYNNESGGCKRDIWPDDKEKPVKP